MKRSDIKNLEKEELIDLIKKIIAPGGFEPPPKDPESLILGR